MNRSARADADGRKGESHDFQAPRAAAFPLEPCCRDVLVILPPRAQACVSLSSFDVAHTSGFTDQAYMTREFARWFGQTPSGLPRHAHLLEGLRQPALGNWTGEQISTR